ncbi:MAG: DUF4892 domain-containing protein [Desulfobacteraceae bacterium]|nr:MAG: DUF4892 domain-containing protein [Desulfobacteraceae bacterium]
MTAMCRSNRVFKVVCVWGLFCALIIFPALDIMAADLGKDIKGSKDIPGLPRYEGSVISGYRFSKFDESNIPTGPWKGKKGWESSIKKAGRRTRIIYLAPPDRSSTEVILNYKNALKELGYETLFECSGYSECGQDIEAFYNKNADGKQIKDSQLQEYAFSPYSVKDPKVFTGKATIKGKESYVFIFTAYQDNYGVSKAGKRVAVFLEETRLEKMEEKMVTLKAESLHRMIAEKGKAAIYGIYFDTNKAVIKPESQPQLEEMAKFLSQNPELQVYIVGHTDSQGTFQYNLDLSQKRAESVISMLSSQLGIATSRLTAKGVACLAPVTSNSTEEGRAKNRRVEMVLK